MTDRVADGYALAAILADSFAAWTRVHPPCIGCRMRHGPEVRCKACGREHDSADACPAVEIVCCAGRARGSVPPSERSRIQMDAENSQGRETGLVAVVRDADGVERTYPVLAGPDGALYISNGPKAEPN